MAHGGPDWIVPVLVNVLIANEPVVEQPTVEAAAGDTGTYTGTSTSYQTVASWTVATGKQGILVEILVISTDYTKTLLQITIGDVVYCTDFAPQGAMPIIFETLKLAAGKIIKVETKSSDGTSITVDALITGREVG